jgi:hypothetical protein
MSPDVATRFILPITLYAYGGILQRLLLARLSRRLLASQSAPGAAATARFYVSLTGQGSRSGPIGCDLANLDEARRCAIRHLARLMCDEPAAFLRGRFQLVVTDGDGVVLATLSYSSGDCEFGKLRG